MNSGIEGNSYAAVISPSRLTYKIGQGSNQVIRDAILIGTNDDEVNYGSTQTPTDLILQMPSMYNNGGYLGAGALSLQVPDGTMKGGNPRGVGAIDLQIRRYDPTQIAVGSHSVVMGGANTASASCAIAMGYANVASGSQSIAMGYGNTSSNFYSVAMGYATNASNMYAVAIGNASTSSGNASVAIGNTNNSSGTASVAMGQNNAASGSYGIAMGGGNTSSGPISVAIGGYSTSSGWYSTAIGYYCVASGDNSLALSCQSTANNISSKVTIGTGINYSIGITQHGQLGVGAITTDATATVLKSDMNALSAKNQCTLQNNNAISFNIEVVARNTSTGMTGKWESKGLIKRGANASTTAFVGTPAVTLTNGDSEGWIVSGAIALTVDTTYGALAVTVTGAASTTIHWMCRINTVEVV
jgi:hypothetical protein